MVVFGLRTLRTAFAGWPFHPAGYALAVSFAMDYFWFAFFLAWLFKVSLIRFGGRRAHVGAIPFFLGLVLGDYTVGSPGPSSGRCSGWPPTRSSSERNKQ